MSFIVFLALIAGGNSAWGGAPVDGSIDNINLEFVCSALEVTLTNYAEQESSASRYFYHAV
jgi:hypothetical protein